MNKTTESTSQHHEVSHDEKPDSISSEAFGGASVDDLPANYFRSYKFIGSFIVGLDYSLSGNNIN
jgi:hypothetical protein